MNETAYLAIAASQLFNIPIWFCPRQNDRIRWKISPLGSFRWLIFRSGNAAKYHMYFGINIVKGIVPILIGINELCYAPPMLTLTVILMATMHLKDVQPGSATRPLSIGGAGFDDGILVCGFWSLILAEWLPKLVGWLKF